MMRARFKTKVCSLMRHLSQHSELTQLMLLISTTLAANKFLHLSKTTYKWKDKKPMSQAMKQMLVKVIQVLLANNKKFQAQIRLYVEVSKERSKTKTAIPLTK